MNTTTNTNTNTNTKNKIFPCRWLIVIHAKGPFDIKSAEADFNKLYQSVPENSTSYIIALGPRGSFARLYRLRYKKLDFLKKIRLQFENSYERTLLVLTNYLYKREKEHKNKNKNDEWKPDAFCFSGHGSGNTFGPWKRWKQPLCTPKTLQYLLKFWKPKLMVLDCCYGGTMSTLYNLPSFVKYVLASPGSHPYISIFSLPIFSKLFLERTKNNNSEKNNKSICQWGKALIQQWTKTANKSGDDYRCLFLFDLPKVRSVAKLIFKHWHQLDFNKKIQITTDDTNLFDIFRAAHKVPNLQKQILKCLTIASSSSSKTPTHTRTPLTNKSKSKRIQPLTCCKSISGMSIENRLPKKWVKRYKSSPWGQLMKKKIK
jgi:hypothetical protein